ncbi:MAG TPA: AMP-binding protein [Desulfobacteraceae bacterium]|nr:AMP-binding protein [Desulfobacteraceae bacterium]HPJ67706.1 AMP-binding protein [Desulfobacteraceae bacterium]HPQ29419.1 AMP-binding protein [Desulfobacteraceae bacterium]
MVTMWKMELETLPREKLEERQLDLFRKQFAYVIKNSPFYERKFKNAGAEPEDIKSIEDIRKLPFTTKAELQKSQEDLPPFGDFKCIDDNKAARVFQTSGTTGIPLKIPLSKNDWFNNYYEQFMYFTHAYDINETDIAFVPFAYGLFIAWWGLQAAMEQQGVTIVPGGGQGSEERIRNIIDWGATVVCGTPSYIIYLGELAKKLDVDLLSSKVRIVVTAGEPGAQVPATKNLIERLWGAKNYDDIGSTEISNFGFECVAQKGTHLLESMFLPESIDPETNEPVEPGENGELVLSNLCCESVPLLRYKTRDLVKFDYETCDCGRTFLRMDGGVLGRADDMFHFAGVNIFPSAIENLCRQLPEFSSEYQLVVPPQGSGKRLLIKIEPVSEDVSNEKVEGAVKKLSESIKLNIKITPNIKIVKVGELPRFMGKAKRIIRE